MWGLKGKVAAMLGAVAVGAAIVGGVALAQTPTPTPGQGQTQQQSLGNYFLDQLAKSLNISRSQLDSALKSAGNATVDEALRQGKLTQDQANRMHDRINQGNGFFGGFLDRLGGKHGNRGPGMHLAGDILKAVAGQLNMDPQTLMSELRSGKSLKDIAASAGVTDLNSLKPAIKSTVQSDLQQQGVAQDRINQILQKIDAMDLNKIGQHRVGPRQSGN
jgi:hypothetical protein